MALGPRDVAVAAALAALYAALVIVLAPISFSIIQVRVADALLPLSIILGPSAIIGLTVGVLIANLFSPFGLQVLDIVGGALANFLATYTAWRLARIFRSRAGWLLAVFAEVLIVTFIVGSYLVFIVPVEVQEELSEVLAGAVGMRLPLIAVSWLGVFGGSLIAIMAIGYPLLLSVYSFLRTEIRKPQE